MGIVIYSGMGRVLHDGESAWTLEIIDGQDVQLLPLSTIVPEPTGWLLALVTLACLLASRFVGGKKWGPRK